MKKGEGLGRSWLQRIQSAYVLPLARGLYLLIAIVSLVTVVGASAFAVYLQTSIARVPPTIPVPPPYQQPAKVVSTTARSVDVEAIAARLAPPANLRFVVTTDAITSPPSEGAVLGHFLADTPNQLAPYPDGVSLLGGTDVHLFARALDSERQAVGLAVAAELVAEITEELRDIKEKKSRTFGIRAVARDQYGTTSTATDITFALHFGPEPAVTSDPEPESQPELTELQSIARDVAQIVEPTVNPAYFSAFKVATEVPARCGANDADETFIANYRRALEKTRSQLNTSNVEAFYEGLCAVWKQVLERESAELERAAQDQHAARRTAEEKRARAQAQNNDLMAQHTERVLAAKASTSLAMSVVGGALAIFLSVSLILGFLAIEGHSRAVRVAIESLVKMSEERKVVEVANDDP